MITSLRSLISQSERRGSLLLPVFLGLCLWMLAGSLAVAQGTVRAEYVGSKACADCHEELATQFTFGEHARLAEFELYGQHRGCESCHGPGSQHVESMDPADVFSFGEASVKQTEQTCLNCHSDRVGFNWRHSEHSLSGITCDSCHQIHQSRPSLPAAPGFIERPDRLSPVSKMTPPRKASLAKPEAQLCGDCHREVASRMMLPSRHPVKEGKMECSSCHEVHGGDVGMLKTSERENDLCVDCHTSKQGPFVFEHQPVTESCATCHTPHGSVADNLLKQNEPFLCLQCHEAHFHIGRSGLSTPNYVPTGGSDNPFGPAGWRVAFGTKCTQCHQPVHGTDLPSQSLTSRGKSLTR